MRILIDTNILGRLAQPRHPLHSVATTALDALDAAGHELRLVPQIVYEFWAIATRPLDENGLGYSIDETQDRLERFKRLFPILRDERGILSPGRDSSLITPYWENEHTMLVLLPLCSGTA